MGLALAITPVTGNLSIADTAVVEAAATYQSWDANAIYNTGDIVEYNGAYYEAQWWTQGQIPGTTGQWGPWQPYSGVVSTPAPTQTTEPWNPWPTQTPTPTPAPTSTPSGSTVQAWNNYTVYNTGDIVSYGGKNWIAGWYTINEVPGTTGQWGVWQEYSGNAGTTTSTPAPTAQPTQQPTWQPTQQPTQQPTTQPTQQAPISNMKEYATNYMKKLNVKTDCPSDISSTKPGVAYGSFTKKTYYSTTTRCNRPVNILLPANYNPAKKYPVMYVLHGIMGNEDSMIGGGIALPAISANLAANNMAKEMIIVCPNIYATSNPNAPQGFDQTTFDAYNNFINDLTIDLMPYIAKNYSILTGRDNTALCGFSMGGRTALYIGYSKPELFGYVGAFSPAPGVTPGQDFSGFHPGLFQENDFRIKNENDTPYVTLISCGTSDSVVGQFPKSYHEILTRNNQPHVWFEVPGADHDDRAIRAGFYNFASAAFGMLQ